MESLAKIRLNGKDVNTLWCYPYMVNVSDFLVSGVNKLEIEIVNQWWNQLIGDEQPGVVRKTAVSSRLFWKASDQLDPAGLLGPVVLETVQKYFIILDISKLSYTRGMMVLRSLTTNNQNPDTYESERTTQVAVKGSG